MFQAIVRGNAAVALFALFLCYSALPAVAQIAPGVTQSAAQTATITGTVIQNDGTPVIGANVRLNGPNAHLAVVSDAHGTFNFISVPYGIYTIDAVAVGNLGVASRAGIVVKGDINVVIQYVAASAAGLKEIARVSTSSAGAQINVTPASIASITPSSYAFEGNASWKELLSGIPGVAVNGGLSFGDEPSAIIPDGPLQPVVLSINGAFPYETSTTLDGMPLADISLGVYPGAGTNVAYLPMPAFDTADVVRGPGANAPSVVDSIGGAFVLHAPGRIDKNSYELSVSNDAYGGIVSNVKAAMRFGKLSTMIIYGINNSPGPLGSRNIIDASFLTSFLSTVNGHAFAGCPLGCVNELQDPNYTSCFGQCGLQGQLLMGNVPFSTAWTEHSGSFSASYDITPAITAQVFYAGSSTQGLVPAANFVFDFNPDAGYTGSIPPGQADYLSAIPTEFHVQAQSLLEEKLTATIGKGILRLAALQNNSSQNETIYGFPNGNYTLYGTGAYQSAPTTPVNFNGTVANLTFTPFFESFGNSTNNRDMLVSYATQIGTTMHAGASYVTSYYNNPSASADAVGSFSSSSSVPSAMSETTNEVRLNAGADISDKLSLDASWYFARGLYHMLTPDLTTGIPSYVDVTFPYSAPRLGVVWRVSQNVAVRAAAGGSYALPGLENFDCFGSGAIFPNGSFYSAFKPNFDLQAEKAFGFDLGTDMRLHHDTVLSFDLYQSNLYGQFFTSTTLTTTNYNGTGLPLYTSEQGNLGKSRYAGINMTITHDIPKGIYWRGELGLTRGYVVNLPAGFYDQPGAPNSTNLCIVPGINFDGIASGQGPVPYANGSALLGYRWAAAKYIDVSTTYYGNNNAYFAPAFLAFNAHAGYPLTRNVSLLATVRNITGVHDQTIELYSPTRGGPTVSGPPIALIGGPYGPRTVILTANFNLK